MIPQQDGAKASYIYIDVLVDEETNKSSGGAPDVESMAAELKKMLHVNEEKAESDHSSIEEEPKSKSATEEAPSTTAPPAAAAAAGAGFQSQPMPKAKPGAATRRTRRVESPTNIAQTASSATGGGQQEQQQQEFKPISDEEAAAALQEQQFQQFQQQQLLFQTQQQLNHAGGYHRRTMSDPTFLASFSNMNMAARMPLMPEEWPQAYWGAAAATDFQNQQMQQMQDLQEIQQLHLQQQQQHLMMMGNAGLLMSTAMPEPVMIGYVPTLIPSPVQHMGQAAAAIPMYMPRGAKAMGMHRRSRSDGMTQLRCYNCDGYGHISKECPLPCSFCRTPGHWSGNCLYAPHKGNSPGSTSGKDSPVIFNELAMAMNSNNMIMNNSNMMNMMNSMNMMGMGMGMGMGMNRGLMANNLRCFNCGIVGHRSVHCLMPCQYCHQVGHWSGICAHRPDKDKNDSENQEEQNNEQTNS